MPEKAAPFHPAEEQIAFVSNRWTRVFVLPILITLLVTARAAGFLIIFEIVSGNLWAGMWPLILFTCLEGVYTTRWLGQPGQRLIPRPVFRGAELVFLALITRAVSWLYFSGRFPIYELRDYIINPFLLFDVLFVILFIVLVVAWALGNFLTGLFEMLSVDEAELNYFLTPRGLRDDNAKPVGINRARVQGDFFRQWIWGGILLTFLVALSTISFDGREGSGIFGLSRLNLRVDMLLAALTYFISGFLLLSHARLAVLNARWLMGGAQKANQVERSWHRASLTLLLIICLGAAFLPLGSTFLLARIIEWIINAVLTGISFVVLAILTLVSFLVSLLPRGAPLEEAQPPPQALDPPLVPPVETPPPPPPPSGIPVISILLWILLIVLVVESTLYFLNNRGYRVPAGLLPLVYRRLRRWWRSIRGGMRRRGTRLRAGRTPSSPLPAADGIFRRRRGWGRWQSLPPREQIRYFFLATVRQASDEGVPRPASLTPAEYARRLAETWPETGEAVDNLTDAFVLARYSAREIREAEALTARTLWQRIAGRLRRREEGAAEERDP